MNKTILTFALATLASASLAVAAPPSRVTQGKPSKGKPGPPARATFIPNAYIVELSGEPVASAATQSTDVAGSRKTLASVDKKLVAQHRARIGSEQSVMRAALATRGAAVSSSVDTVMNAMFVRYKGTQAELAAMPGVKKVYPMRRMKRNLDRAIVNYQVSDVWSSIGGKASAGAGVKIAILDEGIDMNHPGFVDTGFHAPNGYPIGDTYADFTLLNNKVIVGRSYATMICQAVGTCTTDPDPTIHDHSGHGTALAMVSAGVTNACATSSCPFNTPITGVSPGAYLGVYRIWDTVNDTTTDEAIIQAINDAVADGMDVINMSFGSLYATRFDQDPEYPAIENAYKAGVIVVCSAGNSGPDYTSVGSPASHPHAIAAGAATNDRSFGPAMWAPYVGTLYTLNTGDGPAPGAPLTGAVIDAASLNNAYGCNAFAGGSLNGNVVFMSRGPSGAACTFETKLNNASAAGAVGAVVYDYQANADAGLYPPIMTEASATLPAQSADYYSASYILSQAQLGSLNVTLGFTSAFSVTGNLLTGFSSTGPNVDLSIKPDVVAIGENVAMATQAFDSNGDMYDSSGYTVADGTSFASPFTAGVAALIKSARPGLTIDQYRSLIINSAKTMLDPNGNLYSAQQVGAGLLNALSAYQAPVTASPISLGLGISTASPSISQTVTLTNITAASDSFTLSAVSKDGVLQPGLPGGTIQINAGQSKDVPVQFNGSGLAPGAYEGVILATSATTGSQIRIPYWLDVPTASPTHLFLTGVLTDYIRGVTLLDAFDFRLTDAAGAPITSVTPTVTVVSGGGSVKAVNSLDDPNALVNVYTPSNPEYLGDIPGMWTVDVVLGSATGANVFQVTAGSVTKTITIYGCSSGIYNLYGYCP
jgi:minor extracellular serine protease Vpr